MTKFVRIFLHKCLIQIFSLRVGRLIWVSFCSLSIPIVRNVHYFYINLRLNFLYPFFSPDCEKKFEKSLYQVNLIY
jgi:hypothetical protein